MNTTDARTWTQYIHVGDGVANHWNTDKLKLHHDKDYFQQHLTSVGGRLSFAESNLLWWNFSSSVVQWFANLSSTWKYQIRFPM